MELQLGKPDRRYTELTCEDISFYREGSQTEYGEFELDNRDFKETRGSLGFAYENGVLQVIEVLKGVEIKTSEYRFCHEAKADGIYCKEICKAEYFEGIEAFAVDKIGVIVKSQNENGYMICSRQKYNETVLFLRFYEQCRCKESDA